MEILISKRQNTCDISPEFPDRLACVGRQNWSLDRDESSRKKLSIPFTPTRARLEVILSIAVWRLHFLEWDCPIGEPFFYLWLNILKLRAIQIEVLSSSGVAHVAQATVFDHVLPTTADSTLDSVIESCLRMVLYLCTCCLWDLAKLSCYLQGLGLSSPCPWTSQTSFSAADSRRLLLKDFVSPPSIPTPISRVSVTEF